jgi:hypothetical protein
VGPGIYAVEVAVVTPTPKDADYYCRLLPEGLGLVHVSVVAHGCAPKTELTPGSS